MVFDEAQNLKTLSARRTNVARKIPATFKLCLTGTPMENHYGEFFSLIDLVLPGALGSYREFYKKYIHRSKLAKDNDIKLLKLKTHCIVLRRSKKEILKELPEKTESVIKIPFEEKQRKIYRDIAATCNSQVLQAFKEQGEGKGQFQALTALLRLRQVCSDPSAIPNVKYPWQPPKISLLIESIESILASGESILVFTQFIRTFQRIQEAFEQKDIPYFYIHGAVQRKQREQVLQNFNKFEKGSILLMTLKTGGVGLNLTKASFVIHVEPWWNPFVEEQATDRTHRIGQSKKVQVYRYIIQDSVEEKMQILKERKGQMFKALFSKDKDKDNSKHYHHTNSLTQKDLEYLFS